MVNHYDSVGQHWTWNTSGSSPAGHIIGAQTTLGGITGNGGSGRNRTGVDGFAIRCITTLPPSLSEERKQPHIYWLLQTSFPSMQTTEGGIGAGNRVRTGDLNLGKVALYQLSYSRFKTRSAGQSAFERRLFYAPGARCQLEFE